MNKRTEGRRWGRQRRAAQAQTTAKEGAAPQAATASFWRSRRLWLILFLCLAGSTAASYIVFKYVVVKVPPELVGTWEVATGPFRGWTLEIRRDGTAAWTEYQRGEKVVTEQSVRVEEKNMFLTTRDEKTGQDETITRTIVELTADTLVMRNEKQGTYHFKRISK